MEKGKKIIPFALSIFAVCLFLAGPAAAANADLADEAQNCLTCHAQHGLIVTFENNESTEAFVDSEQFKASVHHSLQCSRCHPDFSRGNHPRRAFLSKTQYQIKSALVCRRCHRDEQLKANRVHATLLTEERKGIPTVCTNCHGSHGIKRVGDAQKFTSEETYCMDCHGHFLKMKFRDGETLSAKINISVLQASVHNKLSCSDCHYGFSSKEHPTRHFGTPRNYTLALSENCRQCHFDKYTRTIESIHYTVLSQGNLEAPICIDCHGAHGITHIGKERALIARRCQRCHPAIYDVYAKSVHGDALFNANNHDVPVCSDCHTAHSMEDPRTVNFRDRIPDLCSNCHANEAIVGKYGLSTAVVDSYLLDFHGVTLKFYRMEKESLNRPKKPMAVCTDCHGTHNIKSIALPDATIVKANLVKRCQKCHPGAPPDFPDSWLSHYEPSITRAPFVFFITLAYKIFIPVLVAGLVLQILLHVWRYVVNR
jgi:predicted CXXCH cytochrome family protein